MKICMVLRESTFPGDIRVENEATALIEAGHTVFVVCDPMPGRKSHEIHDDIQIIRVPPLKPVILSKFNSLFYFMSLRNRYWKSSLKNLHHQHQFDVFHVHDLPYAGTVIDVGNELSIPVIFDSHENYPIGLQYYDKIPQGIPKLLWPGYFFDTNRWLRYEKESFQRSHKIIGTIPEMKQRIVGLGISAEKIEVVSNTPNVTLFDSFTINTEIVERYKNRFVISYIGNMAHHRRLDTIIRAMPYVLSQIPDALLLLVGSIESRPELPTLVQQLELESSVELIGWQPFEKIPSYIEASTLGVLPQEPNEHTSNTIPHKLFQYMYMKKPQVVSNCTAVARIVKENACGVVCYADFDAPEAWASAILSLKAAAVRAKMGECGHQGVVSKYNWSVDKARLINLYETVSKMRYFPQD